MSPKNTQRLPYPPPQALPPSDVYAKWTFWVLVAATLLIPTVGVGTVWAISWMIDAKVSIVTSGIMDKVKEEFVGKPQFNATVELLRKDADAQGVKIDSTSGRVYNLEGRMQNTITTK